MEHQVETDENDLAVAVNVARQNGPFDRDIFERDQHFIGTLRSHRPPCPELLGEREERADDAVDDGPGLADLENGFAIDAKKFRLS